MKHPWEYIGSSDDDGLPDPWPQAIFGVAIIFIAIIVILIVAGGPHS